MFLCYMSYYSYYIIQSHYLFTWYTSPKNEGGKVKFGSWIWGKHQLLGIFYLSIHYARIKADRHQDHPEIVWRSIYGIEEMWCPGTKFAWVHSLFWYIACINVAFRYLSIHPNIYSVWSTHTHKCHMSYGSCSIHYIDCDDMWYPIQTWHWRLQQKPVDAHVTQSAPCLPR